MGVQLFIDSAEPTGKRLTQHAAGIPMGAPLLKLLIKSIPRSRPQAKRVKIYGRGFDVGLKFGSKCYPFRAFYESRWHTVYRPNTFFNEIKKNPKNS